MDNKNICFHLIWFDLIYFFEQIEKKTCISPCLQSNVTSRLFEQGLRSSIIFSVYIPNQYFIRNWIPLTQEILFLLELLRYKGVRICKCYFKILTSWLSATPSSSEKIVSMPSWLRFNFSSQGKTLRTFISKTVNGIREMSRERRLVLLPSLSVGRGVPEEYRRGMTWKA